MEWLIDNLNTATLKALKFLQLFTELDFPANNVTNETHAKTSTFQIGINIDRPYTETANSNVCFHIKTFPQRTST